MLSIIAFIKKWVWIPAVVIILALGATCMVQCSQNKSLKSKYEVSLGNEQALWDRINDNQKDIAAYQTTVESLKHINDSTVRHLLDKQEQLKIKNKELQGMLSLASNFHTTDTIKLTDTIFRDVDFALDTTIQDRWRSIRVELAWPGDICVDASMRSQKEVFITGVRETIKPPKKCKFFRLFQKKHTVVRVRIEEDNPYLESEQNMYIQILDNK